MSYYDFNNEKIMNPNHLHVLDTQLHVLPVALLFSRKLLAEKSSATVNAKTAHGFTEDSNNVRATKLTKVLKNIHGYMQGGIND